LGSLKSGEFSIFSKLIKLPRGTKEVCLSISIPFSSKSKPAKSDTVLRWKYDRTDGIIKPVVCKLELEPTEASTKRICYDQGSQRFSQWEKDSNVYSAHGNESFTVESNN
jgi:hypothetical protein